MKNKYKRLELELTMFRDDFDIVRTSVGTASFDTDWSINPNNEGEGA